MVKSLGTNALPFYLKLLREKPPPDWYDKLDNRIRENTGYRVRLPRQTERVFEAECCIEILGPAAEPAIPGLARLLTDEYCCSAAARCLAAIGPAALPALSNAVATAKNPRTRYVSLEALGDLGLACRPAAPLLRAVILTNEPAPWPVFSLADLALRALAEGETNAAALMPLWIARLADTNTAAGAAYGLARAGPAGIPDLLQALTNAEPRIRAAAGAALDLCLPQNAGAYWKEDCEHRFRHFNATYNQRMIASALGGLNSPVERQTMARIVQAYTNNSNPGIRAQATNVLHYFDQLVPSNSPPRLPADIPVQFPSR